MSAEERRAAQEREVERADARERQLAHEREASQRELVHAQSRVFELQQMVAGAGAQQQTSAQLLAETDKLRGALNDARRGHESERLSRAHVEATCQQLQSQLHSVHKTMPGSGRVPASRTYQSDLDAHALAFSVDLMNFASRFG